MGESSPYTIPALREFLIKHLDLEELRTLCQDLGVDYDSVRGEGKAGKARELLSLLEHTNRLDALAARLEILRPDQWSQFKDSPQARSLSPDGESRTPPAPGNPKLVRWLLVGLVAALILILGSVLLLPQIFSSPSQNTFPYPVRVQDSTGKNLAGARVTIEVSGQAPWQGIADSNGLARILVPSLYSRKPARLMVEADGFMPYRQEIDLIEATLPQIVQLETQPLPTPTSVALGQCGGTPETMTSPAGPPNFDRQFGYTLYNTTNSRLLISNSIRSLLGDENGVWVGYGGRTDEGKSGLTRLGNDVNGGQTWEYCLNALDKPIGKQTNALAYDKAGSLWVATDGDAAWRLTKGKWEQFLYDAAANNDAPEAITFAVAARDNTVLVGTGSGITRFNGVAWSRILYDKSVHAIAFAPNGDMWVGFVALGVRRVLADGTHQDFDETSGLSNNNVREIAIDRQGRVWIGTEGGGVNMWENGVWTVYHAEPGGLPSDHVYTIALDRYDRLWAGTDEGTSYFDGTAWHVYSNLMTRAIGFSQMPGKGCSPEDTRRAVWTGTNDKGLTYSSLPANSPVIRDVKVENVPPVLQTGQVFTPTVTVTLEQGYTLTQGDFIQSLDEDSYTSNPLIGLPPGVVVRGGESFTFSFEKNPMRAPDRHERVTSTWRVWQCGRYVGAPITIEMNVK